MCHRCIGKPAYRHKTEGVILLQPIIVTDLTGSVVTAANARHAITMNISFFQNSSISRLTSSTLPQNGSPSQHSLSDSPGPTHSTALMKVKKALPQQIKQVCRPSSHPHLVSSSKRPCPLIRHCYCNFRQQHIHTQ
ncbi:hypothetical protein ElyMa_003008900 [Elysia marginata]|uniref:Uncharacterized protein n=1 Tax=Elysia marginata TaxID=1093978 RepID=A0AAV4IGI3_9GAST|nr:hypothetical protein ElyMa_003008900 [Elysia marginata]